MTENLQMAVQNGSAACTRARRIVWLETGPAPARFGHRASAIGCLAKPALSTS
jgi:hypothetical protein